MDMKEMEIIDTNYEKIVKINEEENDEPEVKYRGIKVMPYIIGNETFEKLGSMGTLSSLAVYLTQVFHMKTITATTLLSSFHATSNLGTILGAYLSDTYLGRYQTISISTIAACVGLLLINLTSVFQGLHPPPCGANETCTGPTSFQMFVLFSGFFFMMIAAAGIRPCNLAFGADQFDPKTESGKRGVDSFFNWYFITLTFAQMVSLTVVVYVQTNISWAIGMAIPTGFMFFAAGLYYMGSSKYVKVKPEGSPLSSIVQVLVVAFKKRRLPPQPSVSLFNHTPAKPVNTKFPYTKQFRCLDKAAIMTEEDQINRDGSSANPWQLCSLQQVETVKCLVRILPIWACGILYTAATATQHQYVVFQAMQSDRRVGQSNFMIPAASYVVFIMLTTTIFLPIYDRIIVPFLRRYTGIDTGITLLQRIGVGISLTILVSIVAAQVETKRKHLAMTEPTVGMVPHRGPISSMSGLWLLPQLSITGLAEAFTSVALFEFYYKEVPENMRSIGGALFCLGMAAGQYFYGFLMSTVHRTTMRAGGDWLAENLNRGKVENFYYLITALSIFNTLMFLACSSWYKYKGTADDETSVEMETKQRH